MRDRKARRSLSPSMGSSRRPLGTYRRSVARPPHATYITASYSFSCTPRSFHHHVSGSSSARMASFRLSSTSSSSSGVSSGVKPHCGSRPTTPPACRSQTSSTRFALTNPASSTCIVSLKPSSCWRGIGPIQPAPPCQWSPSTNGRACLAMAGTVFSASSRISFMPLAFSRSMSASPQCHVLALNEQGREPHPPREYCRALAVPARLRSDGRPTHDHATLTVEIHDHHVVAAQAQVVAYLEQAAADGCTCEGAGRCGHGIHTLRLQRIRKSDAHRPPRFPRR